MQNSILVIDDDRDVCEVLTKNLSNDGYLTSAAFSGEEGIEKTKEREYDLIILDLKLPDIHGSDVLRRISEFNRQAVVIILTAYPAVDTAVDTMKNSAVDYITKPFKVEHLRSVIQRELLKKAAKTELGITEIDNIGPRIKKIRLRSKISLGDLSRRTGLSKSFLSELERKKKYPRLNTIKSIAEELGISVHLLFR